MGFDVFGHVGCAKMKSIEKFGVGDRTGKASRRNHL
jgi:hypothetical protein